MTLNRMPEDVKIDLVNAMALPPACWTAQDTMTKAETKVSTARHEFSKNPGKRKVCVCVYVCVCCVCVCVCVLVCVLCAHKHTCP
jgi:hypothetical protein